MKRPPPAPPSELVPVLPEWSALHVQRYQYLSDQQYMLEDQRRTGAYHRGITHNRIEFEGKTVLDVGCGTGLLSLFAAQAGARKVYAVEHTRCAEYARRLVQANGMADRIEVIQSGLAQLELPEKVDVIISEPWGFFLFHERMVEAFVMARDRHLRPGGRMFPGQAQVFLAPFNDPDLHQQRISQAQFWTQKNFYGIDLTPLSEIAEDELFWMPMLGHVPQETLIAKAASVDFDFEKLPFGALAEITLPFEFALGRAQTVHGFAGWFDVTFDGASETVLLSTSPEAAHTHWSQLRFVLADPIRVGEGQTLSGTLVLRANEQSSYTAELDMAVDGVVAGRRRTFGLHGYSWWEN